MSDLPARAPTFVDLFSGCGGASLGFLEAGFRCLLAVDFDPVAVSCYNANLQGPSDAGAVRADLSTLHSHDDVAAFLAEHGVVGDCDALIGGPPCQSFSVVGRNKINALMKEDEASRESWEEKNRQRTTLFEAYALFLEVLAPRWFFFENVPAIRSHEQYASIEQRFATLKRPDGSELKYTRVPETYWASDYGVPQRRRRFIMVGYQTDLDLPAWTRPIQLPAPTVSEALDDLPPVPSGHREFRKAYTEKPATPYQKLMRRSPNKAERRYVFNHVCRDNNADDVALFGRMKPGARFSDEDVQIAIREINPDHKLIKYSTDKFQDKLHKLDDQEPAWTVTAHLQKDCYKFIHHSQPRTITVREAARLQSFPDRIRFPEALGSAFRLIGNAVPPLLAQAFAESFLASDPELNAKVDPVRQTLPGISWLRFEPLFEELAPSGRRGQKALPLRSVIAAALKVEQGRTWEDVVAELDRGKVETYRRHLRWLKYMKGWERVLHSLRNPYEKCVEQEVLDL
jgi:DNA (cytosine-5)-methyltransferase 1